MVISASVDTGADHDRAVWFSDFGPFSKVVFCTTTEPPLGASIM
jgi:hypothetical protein